MCERGGSKICVIKGRGTCGDTWRQARGKEGEARFARQLSDRNDTFLCGDIKESSPTLMLQPSTEVVL